jgi:cation-transporting ATPase 13A1
VVFLVTTAQQVSVMFVNYKGRPFMQGITENPAFMWSILLCCVGAFVCAFERMPELNAALKLVSMPNDEFRWRVLYLLAASTVGAFVWDRLCLAVFAPHVLRAAIYSAQPDPWELLMTTKRTLLVVLTVLIVIGSGSNLIVLIAVYYLYKMGLYG